MYEIVLYLFVRLKKIVKVYFFDVICFIVKICFGVGRMFFDFVDISFNNVGILVE